MEDWRPIPGYQGYEASNLGRVRSLDRTFVDRWGNLLIRKGQVLKGNIGAGGYRYYTLHVAGEQLTARGARLVLSAFEGARPALMACHKDDCRDHNVLSNLYWGSAADNMNDKVARDRQTKGEESPRAVLSTSDIISIRKSAGVIRQRDVAAAFGVSQSHVSRIQRGQSWGHLEVGNARDA